MKLNWNFRRGGGGGGVTGQIPSVGGMDIFWIHTFFFVHTVIHSIIILLLPDLFIFNTCRASDRVRKKITNYAEIFRNIMRKKVSIMWKTRWIMRKIFGSLRSPKITSCHAAEIKLPPKARVCSQANFKQKNYISFSFWAFPVTFICIWYVMKLSYQLSDVQ